MQLLPDLWDVALWLALTALVLLTTSEILSPHHNNIRIYINKRRLRKAALTMAILFLATVAVRAIIMLAAP
jgi:hypothetical protein